MELQKHVRLAISCVKSGSIGDGLLDTFFPSGKPVPAERALWDYKQTLEEGKHGYAELAKDVLSFFNSYGGYIFIGVAEEEKDQLFSICGFQRPENFTTALRGAIESYSSVRIDVAVKELKIEERLVTAIYVPQRSASQAPAFLTRNGPADKKNRPIFFERTTYFREHDRATQATIASEWEFLNSARDPNQMLVGELVLSASPAQLRVIPANLPDRNLICPQLFGREELLASLWAWIADEFEPVRLLAGAGGKGKTSIAYEFASRFFRNAPLPFELVLWVSAKKRQFRGDRNDYMELPESLYESPRELLLALCSGTAALRESEQNLADENEYTLQKKLRESLRILPSLIVVDDVDSLVPEDQRRVFELVQQISAGAPSKFLLTTRANFAFSQSQCIQVAGLEGEPYRALVTDRLQRYKLPTLKPADIAELQASSGGSPLWTDSILRLMRQGHSFQQSLKEWKGRPGEDARAAALKKELSALTLGAKRILLAASVLGDCSRAELLDITKVGKMEFGEAITELQTLFLVEAPAIIKDEPRFSVPEATAIAVRESAPELVADHVRLLHAAKEFQRRADAATGSGTKYKIGAVVNQAIALMASGDVDRAIETSDAALRLNPGHPDLLMLKARCLRHLRPAEAATTMNAAYKSGQRRPLLFDMWYEALVAEKQFAAALDVANLAIDAEINPSTWLPRRARAFVQISLTKHRDGNAAVAVELLLKAALDLREVMMLRQASKQADHDLADTCEVNDAAWRIAAGAGSLEGDLLSFDTISQIIDGGDARRINVERLLRATRKLVAGVDLTVESSRSRAARTRIADALSALKRSRSQGTLDVATKGMYDHGIAVLNKALTEGQLDPE